jgi:hypothetical protein
MMALFDKTPSHGRYDAHSQDILILVEKGDDDGYWKPLTRLLTYTVGEMTMETTAKVQIPIEKMVNGKQRTILFTKEHEQSRNYVFEVGFPPGNFWRSPLSKLVSNLNNCARDFYMVYLCPSQPCFGVGLWLPEGRMSPITIGALKTVEEDRVPITATSNLDVAEPHVMFYGRASLRQSGLDALYAVSFCDTSCDECEEVCQNGIYGGGDGVAAELFEESDDEFQSGTTITTSLAVGMIITDSICNGETIIATYADDVFGGTPTTGGIVYRADASATPVAVDLSTALFAIAESVGTYAFIAAGAGGAMFGSIDGLTWVAITQTTTSADILDMDFDEETSYVWLAGDDTNAPFAGYVTPDVAVVDITSDLNATTGLTKVKVLWKDHVMFGSNTGELDENKGASNGGSYTAVPSGTTSSIGAIVGNKARTWIGAGAEIRERGLFTDRDFRAIDLAPGSTFAGNVTDGDLCRQTLEILEGANVAVFVTDAGEILYFEPCFDYGT